MFFPNDFISSFWLRIIRISYASFTPLTFKEIGFTVPPEPFFFFIPLSSVSALTPLNQVHESQVISGPPTPDPWIVAQALVSYTKIDCRLWARTPWHWKSQDGLNCLPLNFFSHSSWPPTGRSCRNRWPVLEITWYSEFLVWNCILQGKKKIVKHVKLWKLMQRSLKIPDSITFKNYESLSCTPEAYIILYINYTSKK